VHLVGFITRIYLDERAAKHQSGGLNHKHTKYIKYTELLQCKILYTFYTQNYGLFLNITQFINTVLPSTMLVKGLRSFAQAESR